MQEDKFDSLEECRKAEEANNLVAKDQAAMNLEDYNQAVVVEQYANMLKRMSEPEIFQTVIEGGPSIDATRTAEEEKAIAQKLHELDAKRDPLPEIKEDAASLKKIMETWFFASQKGIDKPKPNIPASKLMVVYYNEQTNWQTLKDRLPENLHAGIAVMWFPIMEGQERVEIFDVKG